MLKKGPAEAGLFLIFKSILSIMHRHIQKLYAIAAKPQRRIIGLMSGTSVDGLDVALCSIEGSGRDTNVSVEHFETVSYGKEFKEEIKSVFSKKQVDLEKLCLLNPWVALQHAEIINGCLKKWNIRNDEVDLIASHGQTIYHAPKALHGFSKFGNATLQIGDGDHLATATNIITLSDFRQKHIAAGGEGAPLAVYGDYLIFSKKGENRIMLNMGGIANFTFLSG
ncbi:MAG: anhydro-N-acetylmuramic acid kinase, partial [Chitinophagaceae bacterium]|nr:anhydro-N-acetylmuramic acid kinase [Chitinophagaceae bacterium]